MSWLNDLVNVTQGGAKTVGGLVGLAGTAIGAPELNWSENIAKMGGSSSGGGGRDIPVVDTGVGGGNSGGSPVDGGSKQRSTTTTNNTQQTQQTQNPSTNTNNDSNGSSTNWDAIYAPIFSSLDEMYNDTKAEESQAYATNETQRQRAIDLINQSKQDELAAVDVSTRDVNDSKRSALENAIRAYNSLGQQNAARFGGGSSTGQAVGELTQQEFARQNGAVELAYAKEMSGLRDKALKLHKFYNQSVIDTNTDYDLQLKDLQNSFRKAFTNINMQKSSVESEKAQQRQAETQKYLDFRAQLQAEKEQTLFNLSIWARQQQATLDGNLKSLIEQRYNPDYGAFNEAGYNNLTGTNTGTTSNVFASLNRNPLTKSTDDELAQLDIWQ